MSKKLSEMSIEELWQLFPIVLNEPHEQWESWYVKERTILKEILSDKIILRISHIGSTAIKNIWVKPIIDILIEVPKECNMTTIKDCLIQYGYICMAENKKRISFNKGYTENGFARKVFHLHLRYPGDNDELYFRDYLNENIKVAKQYESLKLELWKKYEYNRDGYTQSKTDFISIYTQKAKEYYRDRYL